jgi:hypothetical protein
MSTKKGRIGTTDISAIVDHIALKSSRRNQALCALREAEAITDGLFGLCSAVRYALKHEALTPALKH